MKVMTSKILSLIFHHRVSISIRDDVRYLVHLNSKGFDGAHNHHEDVDRNSHQLRDFYAQVLHQIEGQRQYEMPTKLQSFYPRHEKTRSLLSIRDRKRVLRMCLKVCSYLKNKPFNTTFATLIGQFITVKYLKQVYSDVIKNKRLTYDNQ